MNYAWTTLCLGYKLNAFKETATGKKSVLPSGTATISNIYSFLSKIAFKNGSFQRISTMEPYYEFKWIHFKNQMTVYLPGADINMVINNAITKANAMKELNKCSIDQAVLYKLYLELKKPTEGVAIPLQTLIDKLLELKIVNSKIQIEDASNRSATLFSLEIIHSYLDDRTMDSKIYLPFVAPSNIKSFAAIGMIDLLRKFSTAEEQSN